MAEELNKPEEQRRAEEQRRQEEQRRPRQPRHIARSTEPKEEDTQTYVVKEGQTWGTNPELQAGDTVELTEAEAAGFEDKLEPVDATATRGAIQNVESRLEAETGRDFTQTSGDPPTLAETDKPKLPRRQ